jgi:16S rRNA C967 or C1407 C5-methylase (RsmB/RsmF family)
VETALEASEGFALIDCRGELERLQQTNELCWKDLDSLLTGPYLRTIPGLHPCDGFFAAIVERKA